MSEFEVSRRGFLLGAVAGVASLVIASVLPETTSALPAQPWSDKYWFPIGEDTARSRGIPRLDSALAVYDEIAGTDFASVQIEFIDWYNENRRGTLDSAGYCHGLAHAGLREPRPSPETTVFNGIRISYQAKVGLLVALHSGDAMYRPHAKDDPQANFDALVNEYDQTGESFVVDLPDGADASQSSGAWYRIYVGRGQFTDFGAVPQGFNRNWLKDAYRPYRDIAVNPGWDQSQLEYVPDSWQNNPNNNWKFDLDENLVRQMAA